MKTNRITAVTMTTSRLKTYRKLSHRYSKLLQVYGHRKINKVFRSDQVLAAKDLCLPLRRVLLDGINPLIEKLELYVWKAAPFVEKMNGHHIKSNEMVSLDEVSSYNKIPTEEALSVVRDKLASRESTSVLLDNLLEFDNFLYTNYTIRNQISHISTGWMFNNGLAMITSND